MRCRKLREFCGEQLGFRLQVDDDATLTIGPQDGRGQPVLAAAPHQQPEACATALEEIAPCDTE